MSDELRSSEILEVLDADATIEKRASWEGFEFTLLGEGDVEVVNCSHDEPAEHTYTVHVEGCVIVMASMRRITTLEGMTNSTNNYFGIPTSPTQPRLISKSPIISHI